MRSCTLPVPCFVFSFPVCTLIVSAPAGAVERHVPSQYATIQAAVDAAEPGDEVVLAPGTYTGDGNRDIDLTDKAITVRGTDPDDPGIVRRTVIDCQGTSDEPHRGFAMAAYDWYPSESVVSGLTIRHGYSVEGGAVYVEWGSRLKLINCRIVKNSATMGGGVHCDAYAFVEIVGCELAGNSADGVGGAICLAYENRPVITHCLIRGNNASHGAGIWCRDGWPRITGCTIADNVADGDGGGIWWYDSGVTLRLCTFAYNRADRGGAVCGNSSNYLDDSSLHGCILWGNTATEGAQVALVPDSDYAVPDSLTLTRCAVEGGENGVYVEPAPPYWPWGQWSLIWGDGNLDADPRFVDPDGADNKGSTWHDNNYRIEAGSPCVDAADNSDVPPDCATDLDGNTRIFDGDGDGNPVVDIGAYESQIVLRVVHLDIRPGTCPNSLNVSRKGSVAVAITGTADFDVSAIDVSSISMVRVGSRGRAVPASARITDCATPYEGPLCGCHNLTGDGRPDLLLSFKIRKLVSALGLSSLPQGEPIPLTVKGRLRTTERAEAFVASDCIVLVPDDKPAMGAEADPFADSEAVPPDFDGDGDVDRADFAVFQACFNGPNRPPTDGCQADADFDTDGDVDLNDLLVFQRWFSGPTP